MDPECVGCGRDAEKALKIGNEKIFLCDDCASTVLVDAARMLETEGVALAIKFKGTEEGVIIGKNKCKRCGHKWAQRKLEKPRICPKCKSPYWDKERHE